MTSTNRSELERREAALEAELERRNTMSATERQVAAARSGRRRAPALEEDRSRWSTSERQAFAARGVKPSRREDAVKPELDEDDD